MVRRYLINYYVTIFVLVRICSRHGNAELMCDLYNFENGSSNETVYTLTEYEFPFENYTLLKRGIPCPCSENQPCFRKCCLFDDTFVLSTKTCKRYLYGETKREFENNPLIPAANYLYVYGSYCPSVGKSLTDFDVFENGTLSSHSVTLDMEQYCFDYFEDKEQIMILECELDIVTPHITYTIFSIVSILFLMLTFVVYSCVNELRNLQGKSLLSYVVCLIISHTCEVIIQISVLIEGTFCFLMAYALQFSHLAAFFWLNVICFDLWLTFRRSEFSIRSLSNQNSVFLMRSLYAWGCPFVISVVTLIADSSIIPGNYTKPGFAVNSCWFENAAAELWYFYSFFVVLFALNVCLFLATVSSILDKEKLERVFKEDGSRRHNNHDKRSSFLYLKLFLIMGLLWITEIISIPAQDSASELDIWSALNMVNNSQAIFIFAIFVCKRTVLALLNKKLCPGKRFIKEPCARSSSTSTMLSTTRVGIRCSIELKQVPAEEPKENSQHNFEV